MTNAALDDEIRRSPVIIWPGRYAYLKATAFPAHQRFFLLAQDGDEITAVVEEKDIADTPHDAKVAWFKAFEVRCATPFLAKGFLAKIANVVAARGLNILIVSIVPDSFLNTL